MIRIVRADGSAERALLDTLRARSGEVDKQVTAAVTEIIEAVRDCGDEAVRAFTMRFDGACPDTFEAVSYTHLRAHETGRNLVCRLLLEKKKKQKKYNAYLIQTCTENND